MGNFCGGTRKTLSPATKQVLKDFFAKMDSDGDLVINKNEAVKFWSKRFAKVNAENFFDEVDEDRDNRITLDEFIEFWQQVYQQGYDEAEIVEEIKGMERGEAWKKWVKGGPRRPSQSQETEKIPQGVRLSRRDSKS